MINGPPVEAQVKGYSTETSEQSTWIYSLLCNYWRSTHPIVLDSPFANRSSLAPGAVTVAAVNNPSLLRHLDIAVCLDARHHLQA